LTQWLNKVDIKQDFTNIIIYHELSALKYRAIKGNLDKDAFELWAERTYNTNNIKFLATNETYKIFDIEIGLHGDNGTNGSRGSAAQFAKLGLKTIVGHSHSPSIDEGSYVVGHSCIRNMGYNKGPSSWNHAHCLIQPNGKRQMIFIKDGKWKR
jgi:predicted phosphodiesterase